MTREFAFLSKIGDTKTTYVTLEKYQQMEAEIAHLKAKECLMKTKPYEVRTIVLITDEGKTETVLVNQDTIAKIIQLFQEAEEAMNG